METLLLVIESFLKDKGLIHPLIVHFPIALFFVAPVFIIIGWFSRLNRLSMFTAAAILMVLGCLSLQLALMTGESASELVPREDMILATLGQHDELAHQSRTWFYGLTGVWLFILIGTCYARKIHLSMLHISLSIFLGFYLLAMNTLSQTAHHGGKLVHKYGVTSKIFETKIPGPDK